MADISHVWGSDLTLAASGDLALAYGVEGGRQRVLRRLLTALGNDIWHLDYGCGLPEMLGNPADPLSIEGIVRQQMALESAVAADPEPSVAVATDNAGGVLLSISYTDAGTGQIVALNPADFTT